MDRRNLHKVNNQKLGKNKQTSLRTRADNRAAHQDALRQLEPEVPVIKVSRLERLKQWRLERDEKKKQNEQLKKKPFVTSVKRGVFLDKTNYTELNKQRRNKTAAKKTNVSQKILQRNSSATSSSHTSQAAVPVSRTMRTDNRTEDVGLLAIPENSTDLNTTFETQNSEVGTSEQNTEQSPLANIPSEGVNLLTVPQNSSVLNTTFEMENEVDVIVNSERNIGPHPSDNSPAVDVNNMLSVPQNSSVLNTTFEMENSSKSDETPSAVAANDMLSVPQNSSVLNTTFEMENSDENHLASEANTAANSHPKSPFHLTKTPQEEDPSTPRNSLSTSFNYVSPFVTISRGKGSARKEVKVRESFYKLELSNPVHESPAVRRNREAAEYFRFQVNKETTNLMQMVESWTEYKNDNDHVDSVYLDQIDVAIGQTRLLINKKFKQFLGLCDECEKGKSQPPVLPKDLEGFWSMVFMQVENCNQRFEKLTTLKENDWVEVDLLMPPKVVKQTKNRKTTKKGSSASSGIQKMIEEARLKMKENRITSNNDVAQGFAMKLRETPARLSLSSVKTPRSIIKAKTPGANRHAKSVAFSFVQSPSTSSGSPVTVTANGESKPKVIKRRASTSGIPSDKPISTMESKSLFLTPNNRKVSTAKATPSSSVRRSHRRLFSAAEK